MKRMIGVIGLNYKSAPVQVRETVSFTEEEIEEFVKNLKKTEPFAGIIVLSTCNRVEIYYHFKNIQPSEGCELLFNRLFEFKKLDSSVRKHFYHYSGTETVKHIFTVASGIDSMVLGEDQIVGQIKSAYTISERTHCAGPVLTRLFNSALNAGKRVRTETHINEGYASVSSAAVSLATRQYNDIDSRSVLLIGAGQTGRLSMMSLVEKGCKNLFVINRTYTKAEELAAEFHATAVPLNKMKEYVVKCDIIMLATTSTTPLITAKMIEEVMPLRNNRPVTIFDLSVPRNVSQEVGDMEHVTLYDVDDTEVVINETLEKRKAEIIKAQEIIATLVSEFMDWLDLLSLSPTIRRIKENFRQIHDSEFRSYQKCMNESEIRMVDYYGSHMVDKFSGLIIKNLKELTDNGKNTEHIQLLDSLFELIAANEK
ncbi:glutamyl-tRNA reductase [Paludibacter sp.]|uniref:glutamyl-tRNA reductase n=1 Tax=Paludibacter sp. TaxID=1898105 RepID=UPI001355A461|nr:glutamyl-tRNA reductase [Paludibacter sp.]MTK52257.1 glutamyl-tRNA reductase [Paludibacter sp.]